MASFYAHAWGFLVTSVLALVLVQTTKLLETRFGWSKNTCRKLTHIATGIVYLLSWLQHPNTPVSRYVAASVPLLMAIKCILVGLGIDRDPAFLAMSRSGAKEELLQGPFSYALAHSALTLCFWRDQSIVGIVAMSCLCAGDGFASLIGAPYSKILGPLPYNRSKSWMGSLAFLMASFVFSLTLVFIVAISPPPLFTVMKISFASSLVSAVVESLPLTKYGLEDNALVAISACITSMYYIGNL
jgi:phytol kinase